MRSAIDSAFFCGWISGSAIFGWLADSKGRKPAVVAALWLLNAAAVAQLLAPNVWLFALARHVVHEEHFRTPAVNSSSTCTCRSLVLILQ